MTIAGAIGTPRMQGRGLHLRVSDEVAAIGPPREVVASEQSQSDPRVLLSVHSDLSEIEVEWKEFEKTAEHTAFQAFSWLDKWQRHIGSLCGATPAIVLGRDETGRLLFIFQFATVPSALTRSLIWLGSDLCDYNAPILAADFARALHRDRFLAIWRDVVALLDRDQRFAFDLIDLQKMPESIGSVRNPFLDLSVTTNPSGAYVATLGRDWDSYYAEKRSPPTRKTDRKKLRRLNEFGKVSFVEVEDSADRERTIETLIAQKSAVFARMGIDNMFDRPGYRDFYRAVAADPALRGLVEVSRLDVGDTPAAVNLGLVNGNCFSLILSSYGGGEVSTFGPGRVHLHELMRDAIGKGFGKFDFTIGDEPYKRDWCDIELRLHDYLTAMTPRGWPKVLSMLAYRKAKRLIKQTPVLWRAFSSARAFLGLGRRRSA